MTFLFELHRKEKAKIYGNVTFKLQIQTEKKNWKYKIMVVIVILAKPQYQSVFPETHLHYSLLYYILYNMYIVMLHGA